VSTNAATSKYSLIIFIQFFTLQLVGCVLFVLLLQTSDLRGPGALQVTQRRGAIGGTSQSQHFTRRSNFIYLCFNTHTLVGTAVSIFADKFTSR
jgi:hypothetical protein